MSLLGLLATGEGTPIDPPPIDPPPGGTSRIVGLDTGHHRFFKTDQPGTTFATVTPVPVTTANPVVTLPYHSDNAWTGRAALEINGTRHQLLVGGSASFTVPANLSVDTDALTGVTIPAGATVRTLLYGVAGVPDAEWYFGPETIGSGDRTATGTLTPNTALARTGPRPLAIRGTAVAGKSVAICGDSITTIEGGDNYTGYSTTSGTFVGGPLRVAQIPYSHRGQWGEQFASMINSDGTPTATFTARFRDLTGFSHAVCQYAFNDIFGSSLIPYARAIAFWQRFATAGIAMYQTTLTPCATSSDSFTSVSGQTTVPNNSLRVQWNAWLRDGAPILAGAAATTGTTNPSAVRAGAAGHPLKGVIELSDAVESSRDSGKWAVNPSSTAITTDGSHPTSGGVIRMQATITSWIAGLT